MWVRKYDDMIYVCVRLILRTAFCFEPRDVPPRGLFEGCRKLQLERIRVLTSLNSRFLSLLPVSTCATHRHFLGAPSPSCITIHPYGYTQLDTRVNLRSSRILPVPMTPLRRPSYTYLESCARSSMPFGTPEAFRLGLLFRAMGSRAR